PQGSSRVDVFVVIADPAARPAAFSLVTTLRRAGVATDLGFDGRSVKAQFKVADRSGARWAAVIGTTELEADVVTLKDLEAGDQRTVAAGEVVAAVTSAGPVTSRA
ncbi:MAG TPA: His/Gly/Thr/Pro-type tRNA ligase C-terminal domain-containing protein, partial [Egibacteraceae bacterium]|nr:His/Gly/Thr/Pro-type tRNA ligase C-terminal domain-containing protein [Egibacteraceae bacterium]